MESNFKKPVFKHTRGDIHQSIHGSLSEDAAHIASEYDKEVLKNSAKNLQEIVNSNTKLSDSVILESICNSCETIEQLVIAVYKIGQAEGVSRLMSPLLDITTKNNGHE